MAPRYTGSSVESTLHSMQERVVFVTGLRRSPSRNHQTLHMEAVGVDARALGRKLQLVLDQLGHEENRRRSSVVAELHHRTLDEEPALLLTTVEGLGHAIEAFRQERLELLGVRRIAEQMPPTLEARAIAPPRL